MRFLTLVLLLSAVCPCGGGQMHDEGRSNTSECNRLGGLFLYGTLPEGTAGEPVNEPTTLDAPELRYRVLERFGEAFFCDPDAFPVGLSPALVRKRGLETFPEIEKDQETFLAIAQHLGFKERANLSGEQKLSVYAEFKKLRGAVHLEPRSNGQLSFRVGLKEKTGDVSIEGLIDRNGTIKILKRENTVLMCPICLAKGTLIDTPAGPVLVENLKPGDRVWTLDAAGHRVSMPVQKTSAVPVSPEQRVIHLIMSDGRELWASPGHPTADGRTVGDLQPKASYAGAVVKSTQLIRYQRRCTYDLLPAGETGFYWANGILLASTLR